MPCQWFQRDAQDRAARRGARLRRLAACRVRNLDPDLRHDPERLSGRTHGLDAARSVRGTPAVRGRPHPHFRAAGPRHDAAARRAEEIRMTPMALARSAIAMFALLAAPAGAADPYPSKPIRMIVGFAPGGGTDLTARPVAQKMSELLGQQVIVENRPGAAGNIATEQVVRAAPDGYTLLMGTIAALAINPSLYGNLKFDPETDLAPVIQVVDATNVLTLHPSVPTGSLHEATAVVQP